MFEDPDQQKVFTYEYFMSELIAGTATQGDMGFIRPNDINTQCGIVFYQFMVMDSTGADVTSDTSELFVFAQPAAWETDPATATTWTITVNDVNSILKADDAYVFVLVSGFVNFLDPAASPVTAMTTTIFAVQAEMAPLIDVTPYIAMLDSYLAIADPFF